MRKIIVGIFAHPDDETFGPGGTIAKLAKDNDVYIICATSGQEGQNNLSHKTRKPISEIRRSELNRASHLLGVKKVFFMDFEDGCLCNKQYHEIAEQASAILNRLKPDTLITFENHGVSGHLDHIAMSMITTYMFHRLPFVQELWYYCLNKRYANREREEGYFVYYPEGYDEKDIDMVIDTTDVWDLKVQAMHMHESQIADVKSILKHQQDLPKREHFIVVKK